MQACKVSRHDLKTIDGVDHGAQPPCWRKKLRMTGHDLVQSTRYQHQYLQIVSAMSAACAGPHQHEPHIAIYAHIKCTHAAC